MLPAICEGNPSVTGGFPSPRASNAGRVSMAWRHHVTMRHGFMGQCGYFVLLNIAAKEYAANTDILIFDYID